MNTSHIIEPSFTRIDYSPFSLIFISTTSTGYNVIPSVCVLGYISVTSQSSSSSAIVLIFSASIFAKELPFLSTINSFPTGFNTYNIFFNLIFF